MRIANAGAGTTAGPVRGPGERPDQVGLADRLRRSEIDRAGQVAGEGELDRPDLVLERDPAPPLAARAERSAEAELDQGQQPAERAALPREHDAGAASSPPGCRSPPAAGPRPPTPGRPRPGTRCPAPSVSVSTSSPRSPYQPTADALTSTDGCGSSARIAVTIVRVPSIRDCRICAPVAVGPAVVADAGTGQMYDAVDAGQPGQVDVSGRRVPADVTRAERGSGPDQPAHPMAVGAQPVDQGRADQARGARDRNVHPVILSWRASASVRLGQSPRAGALGQSPRSDSNAPSSSRSLTVVRKRAASAPSTSRWS